MHYQFNRRFYKRLDFYIWIILAVWSAFAFKGSQNTFEYLIDTIFVVVSLFGILSTLFRKN